MISGERPKKNLGNGYLDTPIGSFARAFNEVTVNMLNEGFDMFSEPQKVLMTERTREALKEFFVNESCDERNMTPEAIQEHRNDMAELFENDVEVMREYAPVGAYNPVIGMSIPMHKNILMNCIFDKGAIQKAVAVSPKFTVSMETRTLIDVNGNEIDLWKEQSKIKAAMDLTAPVVTVDVVLPETGATNVLTAIGATSKDNLSIETYVSAVKVAITNSADASVDVWVDVNYQFRPGYGQDGKRTLIETVDVNHADNKTAGGVARASIKDTLFGSMEKNAFVISSASAKVKAVRLSAKKDTSNGLSATAQVKWSTKTELVEIASATPINTPISPEEVKDLAALYQVNQLSKVMSMIKDVMENYKDDQIKSHLDANFALLPADQKVDTNFDFAPTTEYALDPVSWREKMFMDQLDTHVTDLLRVLNDANMTVTIVGRPDIIRKIQPTNYLFKTPDSIGPVELDYERVVMTSNKRVYQFISSMKYDKLATEKDRNSLMIILCPKNSERIVYRIYDYQMCVTNDIRNAGNVALPAVHAFERWKFLAYQPVQGRVEIKNPTGLK